MHHKDGIITSPRVILVGSTQLHAEGLQEFVAAEGLESVAEDVSTPLARIIASVDNDGPYTSEELLPEFAGRFCYESWSRGRETPAYNENILEEAHGSVLAHSTMNFAILGVSRALTHELVRHAAGVGISQQSQRYVNMDNPLFVMPPIMLHFLEGDTACGEAQEWLSEQHQGVESYRKWQEWLRQEIDRTSADTFTKSVKKKRANEAARGSLTNSIETKLVWSVNIRALRHVVETRGADPADLEIRRLAVEFAKLGCEIAPTLFNDVTITDGDFGVPVVTTQYRKV